MARKKKPVLLENVTIEKYAAEGRSLARVDGKVVFVEKVVPGDVVDVWITKSKGDWAEGYPHRFIKYSGHRVAPFCEHFGVCGGYIWQMMPYNLFLQLVVVADFKQKSSIEELYLKLPQNCHTKHEPSFALTFYAQGLIVV